MLEKGKCLYMPSSQHMLQDLQASCIVLPHLGRLHENIQFFLFILASPIVAWRRQNTASIPVISTGIITLLPLMLASFLTFLNFSNFLSFYYFSYVFPLPFPFSFPAIGNIKPSLTSLALGVWLYVCWCISIILFSNHINYLHDFNGFKQDNKQSLSWVSISSAINFEKRGWTLTPSWSCRGYLFKKYKSIIFNQLMASMKI